MKRYKIREGFPCRTVDPVNSHCNGLPAVVDCTPCVLTVKRILNYLWIQMEIAKDESWNQYQHINGKNAAYYSGKREAYRDCIEEIERLMEGKGYGEEISGHRHHKNL